MIALGLNSIDKDIAIRDYCKANAINKVFILSPEKFMFSCYHEHHEQIEYDQIIQYKFFYRLLQEIGKDTLVVVNECLRTQDRNDLTYNCIRNFLNQTTHAIIFQYLPLIDTFDDFMILVDFATQSRWKRSGWLPTMRADLELRCVAIELQIQAHPVPTSLGLRAAYAKEKRSLIDGIGLRDPHTIPRNLHLLSGKAKLGSIDPSRHYIGRNNRFKVPMMHTYKDTSFPDPCVVFEYCHNFINFSDFLALSRQTEITAMVSNLKVDQWYHQRYIDWSKRIRDAYATIHG